MGLSLSLHGKTEGTKRRGAGILPGSGQARGPEEQLGADEETHAGRAFRNRPEGGSGAVGEEGLASYGAAQERVIARSRGTPPARLVTAPENQAV